MAKEKIKIGQTVFIINKDVEIQEKEVLAIINEEYKIGYTLDKNMCGGYDEENVFSTRNKAEVVKQNFLDELRFKVGDLIVFKYKRYGREEIVIGKVKQVFFRSDPYYITTHNLGIYNLDEDKIILKVKNDFIENYGDISDLYEEFEKQKILMGNILKDISNEYDKLETELKQNFRKQLPSWWGGKNKSMFEDRFNYEERSEYYD